MEKKKKVPASAPGLGWKYRIVDFFLQCFKSGLGYNK
jgi:hypothetical protein